MPFTLAHPAAALPLQRLLGRWAVPSALVIGSMAPDAVYFLPLRVSQPVSHSLAAVFWFCVPVGVVAYATFHLLLKVPATALLPAWVQERLPPVRARLPAASPLAVVLSLVAGALAHVVWDAFTHAETLPVRHMPWLRIHLFSVGGFDVAVWKLLQHASTAIGLAMLSRWTWRWLRARPAAAQTAIPRLAPAAKVAVVTGLVLTATVAAVAGVLHAPPPEWTLAAWRLPMRRAVVGAMQASGAAMLMLALCWQVLDARRVRGS